jgi:hypothetical protein
VLALGTLATGCRKDRAAPPEPGKPAPCSPVVLAAKRGTPALDGKLDQPVWHAAQASATFVAEKRDRPVPHTEARASWDDAALYVVLYMADEELRSSDRVGIEFDAGRSIEASPDGKLYCRFGAESDCQALGIRAAVDVDGDVDETAKEDEEWLVEVSIPWSRLAPGGRPPEVSVAFRRDDTLLGKTVRTVWSRTCGVIRLE